MKRWFAPRLLALHALAAVAIVGCGLMGLWQLGVYGSKHEDAAQDARAVAPVDLLKVWGPDDPFRDDLRDRRVRIEGEPADELFVVKRPNGQEWHATTVRVRGTRSSILVVLGHAPKHQSAAPSPLPWTFTAILQPPEDTGDLSVARRVNESGEDLFSGYALADPYTSGLKPVDPPDPHVPWTVGLRNLAYALQWWVFGLFAGFMWWRMATDAVDVEESVDQARVA